MTQTHIDIAGLADLAALVGTSRRFGAVEPVYEIIGASEQAQGIDRLMRVRVIESGEELDYKLADILDDPTEH